MNWKESNYFFSKKEGLYWKKINEYITKLKLIPYGNNVKLEFINRYI